MLAAGALFVTIAVSTQPPEMAPDSVVIESSSPCVADNSSNPNAPAVYQLIPDANVPSGLVGPAIAAWNSPSCNPNGTGFPQFTSNPGAGEVPIPLHYSTGLNPRNTRSCGQFDPATGAITLYSQAQLPSGSTGSCGPPTIVTQSLEHEMGHRLGLGDVSSASCPGYIMSQVAYPPQTGPTPPPPLTRSIQGAECQEANKLNTTPAEQPPPPPPNQCPPDCACPPDCMSGCNANGVCQDDPCVTDPSLPQCGGEGGGGGGGGGGCWPDPCFDHPTWAPPHAQKRSRLLRSAGVGVGCELTGSPAPYHW